MTHRRTRSLPAHAACAAALLLLLSSAAPAQVSGQDPYSRVVLTSPSRYWGYSYHPYDPVSSQLSAAADAVRASGDFLRAKGEYLLMVEDVKMKREDVRQKKLETRRKELEHWEWERDFRKLERVKELDRERERQVEEYRRIPSQGEILGGVPLNTLLDELVLRPSLPAENSTKVEPEWLEHVNINGGGRANAGLLKTEKILWPRLLFRPAFADDREKIERLLEASKKLAVAKKPNQEELANSVGELEKAVRDCQARLDREIRAGVDDPDCNPRHQIEGLKFLQRVTDTVFILERPEDARFCLNALEGNTVAEVVGYMKKHSLHFGPATLGSERAYLSLHRALADEVTRLKNLEGSSNR